MKRIIALLAVAAFALLGGNVASAAAACCVITDISADGQITAAERSGARKIQFRIPRRSMLRGLRVGSPVYVNFRTGQVSLDGKRTCCRILRVSKPATPPVATRPSAAPAPEPAKPPAPAQATVPAKAPEAAKPVAVDGTQFSRFAAVLADSPVPRLSFGAPQNISSRDWGKSRERVLQLQNRNVSQLSGIDELASTAVLPQAVKDVLVLHARTLEEQELDSYIVVPELADQWARELPDEMKIKLREAAADDGKEEKEGCSVRNLSTSCVEAEYEQARDDLMREARQVWGNIVDEWGRFMDHVEDAQACFQERRLGASIPLSFDIAPQIGLSLGEGESSSKYANARVTGSITLGMPVRVETAARFDVFYMPCLPFLVRPRSLGANGAVDVGGVITTTLDTNGEFDKSFAVPMAGGAQVPVMVIPVKLGNVEIAVVDVGVHLGGTLQIDGQGSLHGELKIESVQGSRFGFECSGHGCNLDIHAVPAPVSAVESVQLDGRIRIRPAIYAALELSLNDSMLKARAGPKAHLQGEILGCFSGEAVQSTSGNSPSEAFHALTADLDWGVELRAEASAGGQKIGGDAWSRGAQHLVFRDLANSSALLPSVTVVGQPAAGQPAAFTLKMPTCYPYADSMEYLVSWTGTASTEAVAARSVTSLRSRVGRPSASPPSDCGQQSAQQVTCQGAPGDDTMLYLAWSDSGEYALTVSPKEDSHGRRFDASSRTVMTINVTP